MSHLFSTSVKKWPIELSKIMKPGVREWQYFTPASAFHCVGAWAWLKHWYHTSGISVGSSWYSKLLPRKALIEFDGSGEVCMVLTTTHFAVLCWPVFCLKAREDGVRYWPFDPSNEPIVWRSVLSMLVCLLEFHCHDTKAVDARTRRVRIDWLRATH